MERNARNRVRWRRKRRPDHKAKTKTRPTKKTQGNLINYVMNDPSTPRLVKQMEAPKPPDNPVFSIVDYQGGGFPSHTPQGQAANCFVTCANTLKYMMDHCEKKLTRWAATNNLFVVPRAGENLNAYYNRKALCFFYQKINSNKILFTADSSDIVAHELGHAILDSYRPGMWAVASLEVHSFHEAFADITALLHIMLYDEVLSHALEQTKGNIRKMNVFSNLAEEFGKILYRLTKGRGNPYALRSAINDFKYVDPGTLPKHAPDDKLAAECHSFGRILLGALYDVLVLFYLEFIKEHNRMESLKRARDLLAKYVMKATLNAPIAVRMYESFCKAMLWVDWNLGKKFHDGMKRIFMERNLIRNEVKMLNAPACTSRKNIMFSGGMKEMRLSDHIIRPLASDNPLYDVRIDVPETDGYFYDAQKNIIDVVTVTKEDTLRAAVDTIEYLHAAKLVGDSDETPFEIRNGKLTRTYFE